MMLSQTMRPLTLRSQGYGVFAVQEEVKTGAVFHVSSPRDPVTFRYLMPHESIAETAPFEWSLGLGQDWINVRIMGRD
jgi:hypothetical protein